MKNSITIGNRVSLSSIDINTDNSSNRPKQYRYDHILNEPESGIEVEDIESIEGRKEPITMHRVFVIFLIALFVVLSVLLFIN